MKSAMVVPASGPGGSGTDWAIIPPPGGGGGAGCCGDDCQLCCGGGLCGGGALAGIGGVAGGGVPAGGDIPGVAGGIAPWSLGSDGSIPTLTPPQRCFSGRVLC